MAASGIADRRIEAAFAAVPRENFLGPGPWQIVRWVSGVAIFPCEWMRDAASEAALGAAFDSGRAGEVTRLYRRDDRPAEDCWVRGAGWCLAYR